MPAPVSESKQARLDRIQALLNNAPFLPDDDHPDFLNHPQRIYFVRGIRAFQDRCGESWGEVEEKLSGSPYQSLRGNDTFGRTNLNELRWLATDSDESTGNADPARKRGRMVSNRPRKLTKLALFFVSAFYPQFDVQEKDGGLVFLDKGRAIELAPSRDRQYIAYYWRHGNRRNSEKAGVALIRVPDGNWSQTTMTLHYRDGTRITLYTTRGEVIDNILYIQLDDTDGTDGCQPNILTQLTIDYAYERQPFLLGTYTTVHRPTVDPTAGLIVLEAKRTVAEGEMLVAQCLANDETIPAEIRYYLTFQRLDVEGKSISDVSEMPYADDVRRLAQFAGQYQGYCINPVTEEIDLFRCVISRAGRVVCTFDNEETSCEEVGYLRFVNAAVRIDMDYQDRHTRFRYNFFLQDRLAERTGQLYWLGIRAGFSANLSEPMSGRVVLQWADNPAQGACDAVELVEQRPNGPILRDFLIGLDGAVQKFTDSFAGELFRDVMPNTALIALFAGDYDAYLNGRQIVNNTTRIYRHQLTISENGQVKLVGNGKRAWGTASVYRGKYLSIQFDRHGEKGFFGTLILSLLHGEVEIKNRSEVRHLFGALVKMDNQRIEATSVVLQPVGQPRPEPAQLPDPDAFFRSRDLPGSDIDYDRFDAQDQVLGGLLSFLDGQMYRFMRLPRTPNRPFRPRKESYRRVPFYAACYIAGQYAIDKNPQHVATIRTHLRDAYHHGFAAEKFAGERVTSLATEAGQNSYFSRQAISTDYRADLCADFASLLADQRLVTDALPAVLGVHPEMRALVEKLWPHLADSPLPNRPVDRVNLAQNKNGSGLL